MAAPFCDACRAELVARVAYQLVVIYHKRTKGSNITPGQLIMLVQTNPFVRESLDFRLALSSMYQSCVTSKSTSRRWLLDCITASRAGISFRAVFFPAYKATRRDPRVTNRGVGKPTTSKRKGARND